LGQGVYRNIRFIGHFLRVLVVDEEGPAARPLSRRDIAPAVADEEAFAEIDAVPARSIE
jgi:hypothetical protein